MSKQLSAVARQYISALEAQASAEKAVAVAKELLTEAYAEHGVNSVEAEGKSVMLIDAVRRNFDAQALEALVSAKVYREVTKTAVEPKAFDKARKAGIFLPNTNNCQYKCGLTDFCTFSTKIG